MATLKVRGIHSADTASEYSSDEVGTIDDTFLFPKWWDKKANNVETKIASETLTLTAFQTVVAASSDFADFQSRVAAL